MDDAAPVEVPSTVPAPRPTAPKRAKPAPPDPTILDVRRRYREDAGRSLNVEERKLLVDSLPLFAE